MNCKADFTGTLNSIAKTNIQPVMRILFSFLCLFLCLSSFAQNEEFIYDQARILLAQRKLEEAISPLKTLYSKEPRNSNINFLMGAAYTELPGNEQKAVYHLKKAVQDISTEYQASTVEEKNAPVFAYYYLAVALVGDERCAEAEKAIEAFEQYENIAGKYYIREAKRHLEKCNYEVHGTNGENWNAEPDGLPKNYTPAKLTEEEKNIRYIPMDSIMAMGKGKQVQKIEYTTKAPLYGVQVGSTSKLIPSTKFGDLKNVDAFIDKTGIVRYVIGHFAYKKQAETLLQSVKEKGYDDAFVVNVNDERKYSYGVVSYGKSSLAGPVNFVVQLGAFDRTMSEELMNAYFIVDNIQELKYDGMTLITTGNFSKFEKAQEELEKLKEKGFTDAFVVAFNKGHKVPLEEAIKHSQQ